MCTEMVRRVLEKLVKGEITIDEAEKLLRMMAISELEGMAKMDVGREARRGVPEIILAEGKTPRVLLEIALKNLEKTGRTIISRVNPEQAAFIEGNLPEGTTLIKNDEARMIILRSKGYKIERSGGVVGILTAGTADIPVAEEARVVAEEMGCETITAYDVGVAGIHRLFPQLRRMMERRVDVLIVVAGREGALPSVVAGMVDIPVVGVPTSVGYGFGDKGVSALMAMLQACPLGIAVVNIDGGVAAGALAALIANKIARARRGG